MSKYYLVLLSFCLSLLSACSFEAHMTKPSANNTVPTTVAPSIVIPTTTGSSNLTTLPISGECPSGVLEVGIYVSSTLAQTLTCVNGSYSGTLDLSAQPDGPIRINIVATTGSTEVFIVKDTVSPTPPTDLNVPLWSNSHSLTPPLSWVNATDSGAGVLKYQVRVLSSSDNSVIATWQDLTSGGLLSGLALTPAASYKYELRAQDLSENFSTSVQSTSWYNYIQSKLSIDTTTPYPRLMSVSSHYGSTTALSEDESTLVIGAPNEDFDEANGNSIMDAGAVYVYTKISGTWTFQQKIVAMGANARIESDLFGSSVAISGDTIVVGAYQQSYDENGSGYLLNAGAAYVFTRSSGVWSQQQKLIPTGTNARISSDRFGSSVGISGETIVVGSYYHDYDEAGASYLNAAGAAFVFTRSAGIWTQEKKLIPTGVNARIALDGFGKSVAISGDTIVVSSHQQDYDASGASSVTDGGAAFIFVRNAGVWTQEQRIVATGVNARVAYDNFADTVSISGDTLVASAPNQSYDTTGATNQAGAGAAYVFVRNTGVWSQQQKLIATGANARVAGDAFGSSLSISGDTIAVGSYKQDSDASGANTITDGGAAFVFTRSGGVWSLEQRIVATGTNARLDSDHFGQSIAVRGDTLIAGADRQDYDANGSNITTDAGAAWFFSRSSTTWTQVQKLVDTVPLPSRTDLSNASFGGPVAFSEDGLTMVVGSPGNSTDETGGYWMPYAGAVYVYVKSGETWHLQQKIVATGLNARNAYDGFGVSVDISGETLVVGASNHAYDPTGANPAITAGAVFIYTRTAGVWTQQQKIVATGLNARFSFDLFGYSVAISGDTLAASSGNEFDASGANFVSSAGAVFIYTRTAGVWTQQQKIVATGLNARQEWDSFGSPLDLNGDTIVVGSPSHAYDATGADPLVYAGAVFVFTRSAGVWSLEQKIVPTGLNARGAGENFGNKVTLQGNTFVATSSNAYDSDGVSSEPGLGAAYVFTRSGSVWSQQQKIVPSGLNSRVAGHDFGRSVSLDGDSLVVGALNAYDAYGGAELTNAGAVYIFNRVAGVWSQSLRLTPLGAKDRMSEDKFGDAVSIHEDPINKTFTLGIGAPQQAYSSTGTDPITKAGAVYIFH